MTQSLRLPLPPDFRLRTVVFSHGWFDLPPMQWSAETETFRTALSLEGAAIGLSVLQSGAMLHVEIQSPNRLGHTQRKAIVETVTRMFGLHLDLAEFYRIGGRRFAWAKRLGAGRMLRGGSVFEDAVKMLATTDCSWSLTRLMVARLVEELGEATADGRRAFPTPESMAARRTTFFRSRIRAGYRAEAFREFASRVANGSIDPESWATFEGPTDELIARMRQVRGIGPYAAENLCKLLGRFDGLGLDSWCVKKYPQIHGPVTGDVAAAIRTRYEPFGRYRGLALWLDLTRDWHDQAAHADATTSFSKLQ